MDMTPNVEEGDIQIKYEREPGEYTTVWISEDQVEIGDNWVVFSADQRDDSIWHDAQKVNDTDQDEELPVEVRIPTERIFLITQEPTED